MEYSQRIDEIARIISGENITDELRNVVDNIVKDGNDMNETKLFIAEFPRLFEIRKRSCYINYKKL